MTINPFLNYKEYIVGIVTIFISIGGSWEANNQKNSDQDRDIAINKLEIQILKEQLEEQKACAKEILNTVNRIDQTTMELKGDLNLKADKQFVK
jgi:hypothetical protein